MAGTDDQRLVLDERRSWKNLPVALLPASVGIWLITCPWTLGMGIDPASIAPIMLPFGVAWLILGFCISAYHSYLVLEEESGEVVYRVSLVLHSWANKVRRGNVSGVTVEPVSTKFRFVMKVIEGEDLTVTFSDYWRCREWAEQVATFLEVTLVDDCRQHEELSPEELSQNIAETELVKTFPEEIPENIQVKRSKDTQATITIPPRGFGRSQWPRLGLGLAVLLGGLAGFSTWGWYALVPALLGTAWAWLRPLARATHWEQIEASSKGLVATVSMLGRNSQTTLDRHHIRTISVVKGEDVRFEHTDFDRHAVCIEASDGHLQLGAHLSRLEQVEWLCRALTYLLCKHD